MSISGHLRRTVRRHRHLTDATLALAVFAATMLTTFAGHPAPAAGNRTAAIGAAVIACAALAARQRRPLEVLAISAIAAEVFLAETGGSWGVLILLAPLIAVYTVVDLVERRRGLIVAACALAALALAHGILKEGHLGPQNLAFLALGAVAIAAGDSARNRRAYLAEVEQRAERAELERERDAGRRVAEERLRIARDLHDSVGHHLAVISVQSEVAGRAVEGDGAATRAALAHVKAASRSALGELRDTVSLLRQPGDPAAPTAIPAPGLDALGALLDSLRGNGLGIESRTEGAVVPLTPAVDLTAYRVIQESLTNVYKHSDLRKARLTLAYERGELRITIEDLGCGGTTDRSAAGEAGGGHGIPGMRERVLALGGRLSAGPHAAGAFQVTAALPYHTPDLAQEHLP
jgi:signal transduction histidine kinase